MLEKQLVLKGVTTLDDWKIFSNDIKFDYEKDNYFTELKDAEIAQGRIQLADAFQNIAGKYYSHTWIRKNILHQSDEDIEVQDALINSENQSQDPRWINPVIEQNLQMVQQIDAMNQQQDLMPGTEGSMGRDEELVKKMEQVRNAQIIVKQMKQLGKPNRTPKDEEKYKAAIQVLAKNKDLATRVTGTAGTQPEQQQG
jgi:hypothetical protein